MKKHRETTKELMFETLSKLDPTFKPKLNEFYDSQTDEIFGNDKPEDLVGYSLINYIKKHPEAFESLKHKIKPFDTNMMRGLFANQPQLIDSYDWNFSRLGSVDMNHIFSKQPQLVDNPNFPFIKLGVRDLMSIIKRHPELNNHPNLQTVKKRHNLNEYDNYNYPAGADADPNAPWNQPNDPELTDWDIDKNLMLTFDSDDGGTFTIDLDEIIPEEDPIYDWYYKNYNHPEFKSKLKPYVEKWIEKNGGNITWEYDEPDYEPDYDDREYDRDIYDESKNLNNGYIKPNPVQFKKQNENMKTKKNSKQMLFEMMSKIDPTFKSNLNEDFGSNNKSTSNKMDAEHYGLLYNDHNDEIEYREPDFTFAEDNDMNKAKNDISNSVKKYMKYIADTYGTDAAADLWRIVENIMKSNDIDEISDLLYTISEWFHTNAYVSTLYGASKKKSDLNNS